MKLIALLMIFVLIGSVGCVSKTKVYSYKCARACAGEEADIPAVLNEWYLACSEVYYYEGKEGIDSLIEDC